MKKAILKKKISLLGKFCVGKSIMVGVFEPKVPGVLKRYHEEQRKWDLEKEDVTD